MPINNNNFEKDFRKIDIWAQFIGIPFFTIFSTLFLMPYPTKIEHAHLLVHIVFSFIGVVAIWYSIRFTILTFRIHFKKLSFSARLTLQLIITSVITISIIWALDHISTTYFERMFCPCEDKNAHDMKNLYLSTIVLTFLINTMYESFYLVLRLSEKAVETERYKKESIEAQYKNLTSRLNPHFLFNSLNTLAAIVEEDPKKAVNYIRELSIVYRFVLNSQKASWSDLTAELKFTKSYISLLKMRFEENLIISMDICEKYVNHHILPMTIQLLIENAVKHNEISNSHPLTIKIYCEDDKLVVTNNKQKRTIMPSTTKVGLHNISERYRFLVGKEVIIDDNKDTFTVKIPLVKTLADNIKHITDEEYQ